MLEETTQGGFSLQGLSGDGGGLFQEEGVWFLEVHTYPGAQTPAPFSPGHQDFKVLLPPSNRVEKHIS